MEGVMQIITVLYILIFTYCSVVYCALVIKPYDKNRDKQFVASLISSDPIFNHGLDGMIDALDVSEVDAFTDAMIQEQLFLLRPFYYLFKAFGLSKFFQYVYVAYEDDQPVGFIRWHCKPLVKVAIIHQLAVAAEYRCKGYGQQLLQTALDDAHTQRLRMVMLGTLPDRLAARHLYEKNGFIKEVKGNGKLLHYYKYLTAEEV